MSLRSNGFIVLFKFSYSLLSFCMVVIFKNGLLKSVILYKTLFPSSSFNVCFIYFGALLLGAKYIYVYNCYFFLIN